MNSRTKLCVSHQLIDSNYNTDLFVNHNVLHRKTYQKEPVEQTQERQVSWPKCNETFKVKLRKHRAHTDNKTLKYTRVWTYLKGQLRLIPLPKHHSELKPTDIWNIQSICYNTGLKGSYFEKAGVHTMVPLIFRKPSQPQSDSSVVFAPK